MFHRFLPRASCYDQYECRRLSAKMALEDAAFQDGFLPGSIATQPAETKGTPEPGSSEAGGTGVDAGVAVFTNDI